MDGKNAMISAIIGIEWDMFQHVNNIGGRASCQDDWETFEIMRKSQYENWTEDMLALYFDWVIKSQREGRNLIAEKYGRMMEYTEPQYYKAEIEPNIPLITEKMRIMIEEIVKILIPWEAEFLEKYPKLGRASRPIQAEGDVSGFTSMETYARGELGTYPESLLKIYLEYIKQLKEEGRSISVMDRETMTRLYGYESIEAAEESL